MLLLVPTGLSSRSWRVLNAGYTGRPSVSSVRFFGTTSCVDPVPFTASAIKVSGGSHPENGVAGRNGAWVPQCSSCSPRAAWFAVTFVEMQSIKCVEAKGLGASSGTNGRAWNTGVVLQYFDEATATWMTASISSQSDRTPRDHQSGGVGHNSAGP